MQSALSAVLTYLRGPAAAFLLGLVGPGVFLLPALSALQGFFLSYSVACFAAALGRGGVKLALCAFGVRCAFILPCTFFLAAWGMRAAYARLRGPKKRRAPLTGADRTRLALCALLLLGAAAFYVTGAYFELDGRYTGSYAYWVLPELRYLDTVFGAACAVPALLLAAGVFAELTAVPKLLQLGLAAIT